MLIALALELCLSGRHQSQTFDEADHIFAGYRYWKCHDFSANPEHPPMLKLVAAIPLLARHLMTPVAPCSASLNDFLDARTFLYANDADAILFRTRLFASIFTVALAALLFASGLTIFGPEVALIALAIFVFEPTILAHGFLVTTDMAITCSLFASVAALYFYLERRNLRWLLLTGIATGMTLAAKHSGLLVIPILTVLAIVDLFTARMFTAEQKQSNTKRFLWLARNTFAIFLIAWLTLWSFYAFRSKSASPPANEFVVANQVGSVPVVDGKAHSQILRTALRMHILPEAYLYGLRHVAAVARAGGPTFIFGKLYPSGQWFYFPGVLLVKWTVGFLLLLAVSSLGMRELKHHRHRALLFFGLPPLSFLVACMPAKLNLGVRHVLPVFPFVILIAAAGAWQLCRRKPTAKYVVAVLLVMHAASSLASFPNYIPYSNEFFGGTSRTYRVLGESNVDWGQSSKAIRDYAQQNAVKDCWIAYLTSAEPGHYRSGCKLLPSAEGWISSDEMTGPAIDGTVFVGTWELAAPDDVNPYAQFRNAKPVAVVAGSVLVFQWHFDLPMAFALAQINRAAALSAQGQFAESVHVAQQATVASPDYFPAHAALARALKAAQRNDEARQEYERALILARSKSAALHERDILELERERSLE